MRSALLNLLEGKTITPQTVQATIFERTQRFEAIPADELAVLISEADNTSLDNAVLSTTITEALELLPRTPQYQKVSDSYRNSISYLSTLPPMGNDERDIMKAIESFERQF